MKKKYFTIGFILVLLGIIVLVGINKSKIIKEDVVLRKVIIKTVQESKEIDFAKITNFEWETMYVFTPYSQPKYILKEDGISTYNSDFNIEYLDSINMIGFVDSNKLVEFVELPRIYGEFNSNGEFDLTNTIKFSKEEAKFSILQGKEGILLEKINNN